MNYTEHRAIALGNIAAQLLAAAHVIDGGRRTIGGNAHVHLFDAMDAAEIILTEAETRAMQSNG